MNCNIFPLPFFLVLAMIQEQQSLAYTTLANVGSNKIVDMKYNNQYSVFSSWGTTITPKQSKSTICKATRKKNIKLKMSSFSFDETTKTKNPEEEENKIESLFNTFNVESIITSMKDNEFEFLKTECELTNTQLMINAILLISSFGFALYTILNIDHGMTRGWSHSEIMMRIPMDNWKGYEDSLSDKPVFTKTMINVIIYLLGDWLSQTLFQKRNILDFNSSRTIRNGFIGACFGPIVHQYYEFSDLILPVDIGINRAYKIIMDQTIYLTTKVSVYILAVGLLAGESWEDCVDNVKTKIKPITFTAWKFWPLIHCITYTVIPAQHRILWVNCVDLVWNAILALMAGNKEELATDDIILEQGDIVIDDDSAMVEIAAEPPISTVVHIYNVPDVVFVNDTALDYSAATNDTSINLAPIS